MVCTVSNSEKIIALVPIRSLAFAKSRLSPVLAPEQRIHLTLQLFSHVLKVLSDTEEIADIYVVTNDPAIQKLTLSLGIKIIHEHPSSGLNAALALALNEINFSEKSWVCILPGDLATLDKEDLRQFLSQRKSNRIVIAPDQKEHGTNALLMPGTNPIPMRFGANSFSAHCKEIKNAGYKVAIVKTASIANDIDTPEDLETIKKQYQELFHCISIEDSGQEHDGGGLVVD